MIYRETALKIRKWIPDYESSADDGSYQQENRILIGRLTRRRYNLLRRIARNFIDRAPYGRSPAGYPYRCGHDHDCCGCIIGTFGGLTIQHYLGGWKVTISKGQSRNY